MALERPRVRNASKLGFESRILGQGRDAHACAGVAGDQQLLAGPVNAGCRGRAGGGLRGADRVQVDGLPDLRGHPRAIPPVVRRRLEQHDIVYLFLDAIYLKLRPDDTPAEGVLVCWGVTLEGRKVLLGLALGSRESYEAWLAFGRDMIARGLRAPALVIADGAPGIWKAVRELWPSALEQRCTVHALKERHRQAPRAPPPRGQGALVESIRRRPLPGRGQPGAAGHHR